ncbi:MAG: argininosuccinate lyase [Acidimicrobiales bacterium]
MALWAGRFETAMDEALFELSESFSVDRALYHYDLEGSAAHVRGLERAGLLGEAERDELLGVLSAIEREFDEGTFVRAAGDEDIHMAIERRAIELAGSLGARLHTGRSRNDQVATALRLFTRDALARVGEGLVGLIEALLALAERHPQARLPGYTHLQRAQAVLLSHHLGAHAFALVRDVGRLADARERLDVSPLGAGALAGSSLALDPAYTAELLGFAAPFANSMDAVSDRDFVAESLFAIALIGVHLSRLGEELVLWTTSEFGFARLGDAFTTGSSMLPHKKNADVAELARGKAGRLVGNLTGLLVTLKGLPLSYNRDLQEDKEPLFDSVRQALLVVRALTGAYGSLEFDEVRAAAAADDELVVAIDLAEALVAAGVPFREAHERVGRLVGEAVRTGARLYDMVGADPDLAGHRGLFAPGAALAARTTPGAAGPVAAPAQRARLEAELVAARARLGL